MKSVIAGKVRGMTTEQEIRFSELYAALYPKLLRYASAASSCAAAEKLVQDTFHDAWSRFDELSDHENIGGWLMQTLKNKLRNYARTRHRDISAEEIDAEAAAPEDFVDTLGNRSLLFAVCRFVRENFREEDVLLFRRVIYEGISHKQAAAELGITVWTSQKRIERMRRRIREQFPDF